MLSNCIAKRLIRHLSMSMTMHIRRTCGGNVLGRLHTGKRGGDGLGGGHGVLDTPSSSPEGGASTQNRA